MVMFTFKKCQRCKFTVQRSTALEAVESIEFPLGTIVLADIVQLVNKFTTHEVKNDHENCKTTCDSSIEKSVSTLNHRLQLKTCSNKPKLRNIFFTLTVAPSLQSHIELKAQSHARISCLGCVSLGSAGIIRWLN